MHYHCGLPRRRGYGRPLLPDFGYNHYGFHGRQERPHQPRFHAVAVCVPRGGCVLGVLCDCIRCAKRDRDSVCHCGDGRHPLPDEKVAGKEGSFKIQESITKRGKSNSAPGICPAHCSASRKSGRRHFFEYFTAFASRSAPGQQKPPKPDCTSRAAALDNPGLFDSLQQTAAITSAGPHVLRRALPNSAVPR